MKIKITNTTTGGSSEVIDFSQLTLQDLKVMVEYCGKIEITKEPQASFPFDIKEDKKGKYIEVQGYKVYYLEFEKI